MKEHKTQILAALALALALGVAVPGAVFASEGTAEEGDAGIELLATDGEGANDEGDGAGTKDETLGLNESVAELYKRIQERDSFKDFRQMAAVIANTQEINESDLMMDARAWAESFTPYDMMGTAWFRLSGATKEAIQGKKVYQVLDTLKADALYTATYAGTYPAKVNDLVKLDTDLKAAQISLLEEAMPDLEDVDEMTLPMLVGAVEHSTNYNENAALVSAMKFAGEAITDGELSMSKLQAMYDSGMMMGYYSGMASAAYAIDDTVMDGLYAGWALPETGAPAEDKKPDAPDTGIVNWIESGALDMGTLTLIVSAVVAGIAGVGLIAKLYLKHKF